MRVFIAGMDGYLGWSLALYLAARGHEVGGSDFFLRRQWVKEMGSWSAIPIASMHDRLIAAKERFGAEMLFWKGDLQQYDFVRKCLQEFKPDAIVHLGQCPSAPYSMIDAGHASWVQTNNISSTLNILHSIKDVCPHAHLVKLGTMGEYGTPNLDIPEGFFEVEYHGRKDRLPLGARGAGGGWGPSPRHEAGRRSLPAPRSLDCV